jgi:hypothetical protein
MVDRQCAGGRGCLLAAGLLDHFDRNKRHRLAACNQRPAAIRPAFLGTLQPLKNQISVETVPTRNFRNRRLRRKSLGDDPLSLIEAP